MTRVCFCASTTTMSAIANSNQSRTVSVFWSLKMYVSYPDKIKSKQVGVRMSIKAFKICDWPLLHPFYYFPACDAKNKKDSNNKIALICVSEVS